MDLDGQILVSVDELDQERELVADADRRAVDRLAVGRDEVAEGQAGEWAIGHPAHVGPVIGDFPAFGELSPFADRLAEDRRQPTPAPNQALVDRLEAEGMERVDHDPPHRGPPTGSTRRTRL